MLVRNFCGLGFHWNVHGYCVRNIVRYRYVPPCRCYSRDICHYPYRLGADGFCHPGL